ncbi:MAG: O-antigen ligase family protein [Mycobacterium sp.]|nr:O-antigen ligase family protein [Mycobacterium sp.]
MASLPLVFLIGALTTIKPELSIAAIAMCLLTILLVTRSRPLHSTLPTGGLNVDWVVVLLPTALAIRTVSGKGSLLLLGLLVVTAFARKPDGRFRLQAGPLVLLLASSAIVFSRPAYFATVLTFLIVAVLVVRLVTTVDARKIIASLVDGCGLYLLVNVLGHAAGLQSPASNVRIGGLVESSGFVRTIYPFTFSINTPPIIAAVYVACCIFLMLEAGWIRRFMRLVCLASAIIILVGAGTRAPIAVAVGLAVIVICFPFTTRWLGQLTVALSAASAFILPAVITSIQFIIAPLMSLTPGRQNQAGSISSINGRDRIWSQAINYWVERVNDLPQMMFGFGVNGQYRSGASLSYSEGLSTIVRNPEFAYTHNSFLQQLFDGGVVGWILLVAAVFWASRRLAQRVRGWGFHGLIAVLALAVLVLSGMTEVSLAPGVSQDTFWLLLVLVGVSCQTGRVSGDGHGTGGRSGGYWDRRRRDGEDTQTESPEPTNIDELSVGRGSRRSTASARSVSSWGGASRI